MTAITPNWIRDLITATTENEHNDTITRYTGWRAILFPANPLISDTQDVADLNINADDAVTEEPAGIAYTSVTRGTDKKTADAAQTALAELGFRIDGPWVPGPNGTLIAPLAPVILDPTCAAYEPETATAIGATLVPGEQVEVEDAHNQPSNFPRGVIVERPADMFAPTGREAWVWVRFDGTGDVCPIRGWRVRRLPASRR